jgi:hypothetical protein
VPWLDRTGPRGLGPMTGGGFGFCSGFLPSGYRQPLIPQTSVYPNYPQNQYPPQTSSAIPMLPMQQPYYGGNPYGRGIGRGSGLGYGRGLGLGLGLGWGRGMGQGLGYGRGFAWRRRFF